MVIVSLCSFKTKGNLTKHMKSKSHAKKCEELGVCPLPTAEDMMEGAGAIDLNGTQLMTVPGDSDSDDDSDGDDQSDGSDSEDIRARLPQEQEAARGLLSLSMTPPMMMSHTVEINHSLQQPHQPPTVEVRLGEDLSVRNMARTEVAVPKVTFEFPRPEQYYSNPNIVKPSHYSPVDEADNSDLPMDLTKPRSMVVCAKIPEPAGLISSLVSITDRFPIMNGGAGGAMVVDEGALQVYLTECAMKQQQQKKEYHLAATKVEPLSDASPSMLPQKANISDAKGDTEETKDSLLFETKPNISGTENLSEASSVDRNTTAKFLASEYLKMATQRNTLKSDREDGESSSDQEVVSEGGRKRTDSVSDVMPRTVVVVAKDHPQKNSPAEFVNLTGAPPPCRVIPTTDDGRSVCDVCRKTFQKPSQLKLHMNIHYLERKFRCEPCGVSFRTQGHLHKHERSVSHHNKVSMTSTFGVVTTVNPRPFNCTDCRVAFRIHGHLAKHLRSKMHVLRLECLCKVPFGTYAEIERAGINLTAIDTKDCDTFLASLIGLVKQLPELNMSSVADSAGGAGSNSNKASGEEESDNEELSEPMGNGYGEPLSGNENGERHLDENKNGLSAALVQKRKFGTLLAVSETTTTDEEHDEQNSDGGGCSGAVLVVENSSDGGGSKEFPPLEKRIKVN